MPSESLEMEVINENDHSKPSSAPPPSIDHRKDDEVNRKALFRRSTGSKKHRRRPSRMSSSSSLHSLMSILKPANSDQRSAPNVSFGNDYNDINIGVSKNSLSVNMNPSIGETSSQFHYAMEGEGSSRAPGGSFSTQTSTIGFRASFFSVLEKLGVWRSQDLYKAAGEAKAPAERKVTRNSVTSLYFRTVYGGKYNRLRLIVHVQYRNLLQSAMPSITLNLNAKRDI